MKQKSLLDIALTEDKVKPPSVIYRALIEWREGVPYLVNSPIKLSPSPEISLIELQRKCLDLPYTGKNPQFVGLSHGEAMMVALSQAAAEGDKFAISMIMDRLLGRAQQNVNTVSLKGDLNEFLDKVAEETKETTIDIVRNPEPSDEVEDL